MDSAQPLECHSLHSDRPMTLGDALGPGTSVSSSVQWEFGTEGLLGLSRPSAGEVQGGDGVGHSWLG